MTYDYGDEVGLRTTDEGGSAVVKPCAVVGITPVTNESQAEALGHPIGTVLYTVEFDDGTDALFPVDRLEPLT